MKAKFDPGVSSLCGCGLNEDSIEHRALVCPLFQGSWMCHLDVVRMWFFAAYLYDPSWLRASQHLANSILGYL